MKWQPSAAELNSILLVEFNTGGKRTDLDGNV
jgi:hypothetical protein